MANSIIKHIKSSCYILLLLLNSCSSPCQVSTRGIKVRLTTHFFNENGDTTFTHYFNVWANDSIAIEEITGVNTVTDTANISTVTYPVILYRYIDLRRKTLYDYRNFSDTAMFYHKAILPDSLMQDFGWSFYSEKAPKIQGVPEPISDTVIENITYKRAKFIFTWHNPKNSYLIGYFRCDGKGDLFSLEKVYSKKINCAMVKYYDYKIGRTSPIASLEVEFISDSLSTNELKVLDCWRKNAKNNPILKK